MSASAWDSWEFDGAKYTRWRDGVRARIEREGNWWRIRLDGCTPNRALILSARLCVRHEEAMQWADRLLEILEPVPDVAPSAEVSP